MRIERDILPYVRAGMRVEGCHTQALLSCCTELRSRAMPALLEACTTVPFGIAHVPGDANRLLDCVTDPDKGLDLACTALDVDIRFACRLSPEQDAEATEQLVRWLEHGPVLLGPMNMGKIPYLRNMHQYSGLDHYVAAIDWEKDAARLCLIDPERVNFVNVAMSDLLPAWAAEGLKEGRGPYSMRQILSVPHVLDWQKAGHRIMPTIRYNMEYLAHDTVPQLTSFCFAPQFLKSNPSLRSGLIFCVRTRIRRIFSCCALAAELLGEENARPLFRLVEDGLKACHIILAKLTRQGEIDINEVKVLAESDLEFCNQFLHAMQS